MARDDNLNFRSRRQAAPGTGSAAAHRQRARKGEGELLRTEILDVAEQLLVEKGHTDAVSMRAIAERVGVSAPAIYMHFDDKDHLFFECCFRRFNELSEVMGAAAASHSDPASKMRAIGRAYIEFGLGRAEQYEVMMLGPVPETAAVADPADLPGGLALLLTADVVKEGMAAGAFRDDLDPLSTAAALWSAVHGAVIVLLAKRRQPVKLFEDEELVVDHVLDIISRGIAALPQ